MILNLQDRIITCVDIVEVFYSLWCVLNIICPCNSKDQLVFCSWMIIEDLCDILDSKILVYVCQTLRNVHIDHLTLLDCVWTVWQWEKLKNSGNVGIKCLIYVLWWFKTSIFFFSTLFFSSLFRTSQNHPQEAYLTGQREEIWHVTPDSRTRVTKLSNTICLAKTL